MSAGVTVTSRQGGSSGRRTPAGGWNVLLAPVGTPGAVVQKASLDLRKAMDDVEVKKKLAQLGAYTHAMSPKQVTQFAIDQQRTWKPIAEKVARETPQ